MKGRLKKKSHLVVCVLHLLRSFFARRLKKTNFYAAALWLCMQTVNTVKQKNIQLMFTSPGIETSKKILNGRLRTRLLYYKTESSKKIYTRNKYSSTTVASTLCFIVFFIFNDTNFYDMSFYCCVYDFFVFCWYA